MRTSARPSLQSVAVVSAVAVILAILAALQYRWIGQVSEADRERLQSRLESSVEQFRQAFNRELMDVSRMFRRGPVMQTQPGWDFFATEYENWRLIAPYPELVANLYIQETNEEGDSRLVQFNHKSGEFEPSASSGRFDDLLVRPSPRRGGREMRPLQWVLDGETPLLIQPLQTPIPPPPQPRVPMRPPPEPAGLFIIELNMDFIRTELLPEMASRYFGNVKDLDYHVAVLSGHDPIRIIYRSDEALPAEVFSSSDARISLFREPGPFRPGMAPQRGAAAFREGGPAAGMFLAPRLEEDAWELVVKHRQGSLAGEVERIRRRNLVISFGILLLLGLSTAMIIVYTQRAQRLARLQVEFVAGVSHELRSPLAVICSAGDNLAEGIVDSAEQVREYGALIRDEGRRLSGMVEQTLQFASSESGRKRYNLQPVNVGGIIDIALKEAETAIQEAGFTVEKRIEEELPQVEADSAALAQCLQNLITNALKYGHANRWMGILAMAVGSQQGPEVQITVEDRGAGIEPEDLPHVFEPFYQGDFAGSPKSPGVGLGLSLVKSAIEAMGGSISVKNAPGKGSSFTLHLPALIGDRTQQNGT